MRKKQGQTHKAKQHSMYWSNELDPLSRTTVIRAHVNCVGEGKAGGGSGRVGLSRFHLPRAINALELDCAGERV